MYSVAALMKVILPWKGKLTATFLFGVLRVVAFIGVGVLSALVRQNPDLPMFVPRRWLVVENVAVLEAYRGMGVGRALMQHAHEWARGQGLAEVELTVWEFNEGAVAFYEQLGYTTIVRRLWKALE